MNQFDPFGVNAAVREFHEQHGKYVQNQDGTWFLFEDGARMQNHPWPTMIPPPDSPIERAELIEKYHRTRVERATPAFDERKGQILSYLSGPDVSVDDEDSEKIIAELKGLQDSITELQKHHRKALDDLAKAKGETPKKIRQQHEYEAEKAIRKNELLRKVKRIVV